MVAEAVYGVTGFAAAESVLGSQARTQPRLTREKYDRTAELVDPDRSVLTHTEKVLRRSHRQAPVVKVVPLEPVDWLER